jgi:N-acetylmuramoyl-L-alanine amidase
MVPKMAAPRTVRVLARLLATAVAGGLVLGLFPPALGQRTPPTVIRVARLGELKPARAPAGPGIVREASRWTEPVETCAPITFTAVAYTWRQEGDDPVLADLSWRGQEEPRRLVADLGEGPDPGSEDDSGIAGTPLQWTGESRCVRARFRLPADRGVRDLRAVFINTSGTATGGSPLGWAAGPLARLWGMVAPDPASAMTHRPPLFTREEWGANESWRSTYCDGKPDYADRLKMAYVHHTAGSNEYSKSESDDVVRAIYSYHVHGRHYCDIAYNFLVDRFGRIFEGRFGGMAKPVIGAHASGFNTGSTGISAMGDFTSKVPSVATRNAFKRILAWRLDVAHRPPAGWTVMESGGGGSSKYGAGDKVRLRIITGHKDTSYTACPGGELYSRLGQIRTGAKNIGLPKIWKPRQNAAHIDAGVEKVQWRARLSQKLAWTVRVTDEAGAQVRTWTGYSDHVAAGWKGVKPSGKPVEPGMYTVTFEARRPGGAEARSAIRKLRVDPA